MKKHSICELYESLNGADYLHNLLTQSNCEVDLEFPGFMDVYAQLSKFIPYDFTIIDFGCYIGLQAIYFRNHVKYIGVDSAPMINANLANTQYYLSDIYEFINNPPIEITSKMFAICSYVPIDTTLIRQKFSNVFCYYPV